MRPHPAMPWLFRTSAVLWAVWGAVHLMAGVLTMKGLAGGEIAEAVHAITPKAPLASLQIAWPAPAVAVLSQHGWNLAWFGLVTLIAAPFVWRRNTMVFWVAALVGGMADLGYFIFIDLGGYAEPPGPQMTYICAAAIISGVIASRIRRAAEA